MILRLSIMVLTSLILCNVTAAQVNTVRLPDEISTALAKPVTMSLKNVTLNDFLNSLSEETGIGFNYSAERINADSRISLSVQQKPASEVLMKVLNETGNGLIFTEKGLPVIMPVEEKKAGITGTIIDSETREPLIGVNVIIPGTSLGASTSSEGTFSITQLSAGIYTIAVSMIGYETKRIENIIIKENESEQLFIELESRLLTMSEIVVTPGHFSLMEKQPAAAFALSATEIRSFPQIGEDIYRAVNRLPGIAGNDFSAKFTIRGGSYEEVLVQLDGMELYDPFHLKVFDGFFSVIDVEYIKGIDLMTGAFPAEFGNRQSGVFSMKSIVPSGDKPKTSIGISFLNARIRSEGTFNNNNGQWLAVARRGYLDLMLKRADKEETSADFYPRYYDFYTKLQYTLNPRNSISMHLLATDDFMEVSDDNTPFLNLNDRNVYGWAIWNTELTNKLNAQTMVSGTMLDYDISFEKGLNSDSEFISPNTDDERSLNVSGIKQDWEFEASNDILIKGGIDYKNYDENYDFYFVKELFTLNHLDFGETELDTTDITGKHTGSQLGIYLSSRFRIIDPLTAELGVRHDKTAWSDDRTFSPRLNLSYDLNRNTTIRLGWGRYFQTQNINEHKLQYGEKNYFPAEISEHRVLGYEYKDRSGINLRIEAYQKKLSNIRPRYHNFIGSVLNPLQYAQFDLIRLEPEKGESRGLEIHLNREEHDKLKWWLSYSYARVHDIINGEEIVRDFDQTHTLYADLNYRLDEKWSFNVAFQYHTGWPHTKPYATVRKWYNNELYDISWHPGPLNAQRVPSYHRMDVRATRSFNTSFGTIMTFLEIRNLYNRKNIREIQYYFAGLFDGIPVVRKDIEEHFIPLLPSFGITWNF
ncbi:TonB-dependent receptor domain-containing protein [candidate division KSB1 bacterium]